MATIDIPLLRLQYEILNTPIAQLASEARVPVVLLQQEIDKLGWIQRWPDAGVVALPSDTDEPVDVAEAMALETEQILDNGRRRLQVYHLAKEMLLAHRYLAVETELLSAVQIALSSLDITAQGLKQLSGVYKDLSSGNMIGASSITLSTDENGMPTAIIRDLSGSGK